MNLRDHVRFRSPRFRSLEPMAEQLNPGRYGKELATWTAEQLSRAGLIVSAPQEEDWGWYLTFGAPARKFFLGCGNVDDEEEQWLIFMHERPGFLNWLSGRTDDSEPKIRIVQTLEAALRAEPSVSEMEWFREGPGGEEIDHAPHP